MKKLTPHFSLHEFFASCTSTERLGAFEHSFVLYNLFALLQVMQYIRTYCDAPIIITSGYRDREHNILVSGVYNSQHLDGCACDFMVCGVKDYRKLAKQLSEKIEFDQMIAYDTFIHISYSRDYNRNQLLIK